MKQEDDKTKDKKLDDLAQEEEDEQEVEWARIDKTEIRQYLDDSEPKK